MNALTDAAVLVQRVLDDAGIAFCFIGGFAAQRHAEPRAEGATHGNCILLGK